MLCKACHVHVRKDFPYCLSCGTFRKGAEAHTFAAPELSWGDPTTVAALVKPETTVGRVEGNDVVIDDPSVSRAHARIVRDTTGFHVEDLGSFNGTTVRLRDGAEQLLRGQQADLRDGSTIFFGDVPAEFAQRRTTLIGSRTQLRGAEHTMLRPVDGPAEEDEEPATATEPLSAIPIRHSGWALKQVATAAGAPRQWVLSNTRNGRYLSLDERQVHIWNLLDGERSMRDLLFAYLEEFGELALPKIESAVQMFGEIDLVHGLPTQEPEPLRGWKRIRRAAFEVLIKGVEVAIANLDPLVGRAYRAFGWWFFTPLAVLLLWALTLGGLYGFWEAGQHRQLFDMSGAGALGGVVAFVGYLVATAVHEAAHAFAVKSYGRRVNRGGFMLKMGMPFAFVDTSDMWFGTPYSRIVVAVSGPLVTAGIAGGASLVAAYSTQPQVAGVCFTLAYGLYVNTLFNLIPLMPMDGYQAFADALRTPRLKEEAKVYLTKGMFRDIRARRRPSSKQWGLLAFGAASAVCLYVMLMLAVQMWNSRLSHLLVGYIGQPLTTVVVEVFVALLLFPVWYPVAHRVSIWWQKRQASSRPTELVAQAG